MFTMSNIFSIVRKGIVLQPRGGESELENILRFCFALSVLLFLSSDLIHLANLLTLRDCVVLLLVLRKRRPVMSRDCYFCAFALRTPVVGKLELLCNSRTTPSYMSNVNLLDFFLLPLSLSVVKRSLLIIFSGKY